MEAVYESSSCPVTAMEAVYESLSCPVTAIEAVCEASCCPVMAMEAVCDLLPCPELAMEACHELLSCPNPTKEAISELLELLSCPESAEEAAYELPALSVTTEEVIGELLDCSDAAIRAVQELSSLHVTAMKTVNELPVCPINPVTSPVNTCERSVCLIHETNGELSTCSVFQQVFDFPVYQEPVNSAKLELSVLPVSIDDFTMELSACLVSSNMPDYDPSVLSVSVWELNYELSARSVSPNRSNVESSVCPISSNVFEVSVSPIAIHEPVICPLSPVTTPETLTELPVGSSSLVTAQRPTFKLLTLPVVNSETINVLYVCPVSPVISKETINELSIYPVSVNGSKFKSHVCPVSTKEPDYELFTRSFVIRATVEELFTFPVSVLGAVSALSVLSVSALPRSQSRPWSSLSAPAWWSSVPLWWSSAPPWWAPSAPPWWAPAPSAPPWWALAPSAPPWWAPVPSAPPWWAPVPSSLPWLPALLQSPVSPFAHGLGPPSLPLFHLRSTSLLDRIGASGSRSLGGALSRIRSVAFHPIATRGHSSITLTFTPHRLLDMTLDCNSHHPLH